MSILMGRASPASPASFALTCLALLMTRAATADSIRGTATWSERMVLPPTSVFEAVLEDVSRADAPAEEIARMQLSPAPNPPIAFEIAYDPARVRAGHRYAVRGRILVGELLLFTTDSASEVSAGSGTNTVSLLLRRAGSPAGEGAADATSDPGATDATSEDTEGGTSDSAAGAPSDVVSESSVPLESTHWKAIELEGTAIPTARDPQREAHIVLDGAGRFGGSDSCNRVTGSYQVNDDAITFEQVASTRMACPDTGETERQFHAALDDARSYRIVGNRLELSGVAGTLVARFESDAARSR